MDCFRKEAEQELCKQIFRNAPPQYHVIEIFIQGSIHTSSTSTLAVTNLRETTTLQPVETEPLCPSLQLVKVEFEPSAKQKLYSTAGDIIKFFRCFELDTYMLYLMYRDIMGFYEVSRCNSRYNSKGTVFSYFINIEPLKVLWSFNTATLATRGVILARATPGGRHCYQDFCHMLDRYCRLVAHPLLPAFAAIMEIMDFSDRTVNKQEEIVSQTELKTGFSPWSLDVRYNLAGSAELDSFNEISQQMGASLVELEDIMRQTKVSTQILAFFQDYSNEDCSIICPDADKAAIQAAHQSMSQILLLGRKQLVYSEIYIGYLRERAKNQLTVVFNLITRGDAQVNIDLARSVKADGLSMKVIAIMTMVFLPGTFFAALFSVPSLQWDRDPVIQSNFWVYWVFTIPCTALIFCVWLISVKLDSFTRRSKAQSQVMCR